MTPATRWRPPATAPRPPWERNHRPPIALINTPRRPRRLRVDTSVTTRRHPRVAAALLAAAASLCLSYAAIPALGSHLSDLTGVRRSSDTGTTPTAGATPSTGAPNFPFLAYGPHHRPDTWPCGAIHWRLVSADAPRGAENLARKAFANITATSDLRFAEDDPIASLPNQFTDTNYHGITVAWVPRVRFARETTASDAIGVGGPTSGSDGHYLAGTAWLLADWPDNQILDFGTADAGHVLLHELGHALGLGHVINDPNAVMNPDAGESTDGETHWSPAEQSALRYLHASCGLRP